MLSAERLGNIHYHGVKTDEIMSIMRAAFDVTKTQVFEVNLKRNIYPVIGRLLSTDHGISKKQTEKKSNVREMKGRPWVLFASPPEVSLVCAVSADFQMHHGIARYFKKTYESIEALKEQNKTIGDIAILNRNEDSFVYYLVTRERWWDKGTKEAFYSSISTMKDHCVAHGVTQINVPRLGTAEDDIGWSAVKDIIEDIFHDTGVSITAYTSR